jgi:hypothetical protein
MMSHPVKKALQPQRLAHGSRFASAALARSRSRARDWKHKNTNATLQWIDELAERARFRRTLVVVKRKKSFQPSSLERGSAATRTVVRSISQVARPDELTHISKINRR